MRLPLCDRPERLAARLYVALRVDPCGCCTFYRGVALGLISGIAIAALVHFL